MTPKIHIPERSIILMSGFVNEDYKNVSKNPEYGAQKQFNLERVCDRIKQLKSDLDIHQLMGKKILEVGCGSGLFIAMLQIEGAQAFGVEPVSEACEAANLLLEANGLAPNIEEGFAEELPFENDSFDIVVSFQVLEHTKNPFQALKESSRVLKPGGVLYFIMPNYNSFWEGHYGIPWAPFLNKALAKRYVRLLGRNEHFIDSLNFVTPSLLSDWTNKLDLTVLNLGHETFRQNLLGHELKEYWSGNKLLQRIIRIVRSSGLAKLVGWVFIKFDWHYPITFVAKKG